MSKRIRTIPKFASEAAEKCSGKTVIRRDIRIGKKLR